MTRASRARAAALAAVSAFSAISLLAIAPVSHGAPAVAPVVAGDPIKVDTALDLVPMDALGFVIVADPKATSDDLAQCLERMERPEVALMGRPLDMLKAQAGIGAGFDDRGPVVAWWQMPPGGAGAPAPAVVIGTIDAGEFLKANLEPAPDVAEDAWRRDGTVVFAKSVEKLVVLSPEAALARGWTPKPGFAAKLRQRLGERGFTLIHGAEISAWAGPEALAMMREQALVAAKVQAGEHAAEVDRLSRLGEGLNDALLSLDVDPLGLSIRTLGIYDPESKMGALLRGGDSSGDGVDRLPGGPHYLAMSIDLRGLGGGGPFMELVSLLDADAFVPGWIRENRDLVDRVQIGLYPSRLGLASGLFNDSAIFVQTKDPEKVRSLWREWIQSLAGTRDGVIRRAEWEPSRALRSGGEATAFAVTEEVDPNAPDGAGGDPMAKIARQLVIGPKGFIGFMRIVPGGVVMTFSQRTDVLGRATEAAAGTKTMSEVGTIRALRRWLIPHADFEGFVGVGPLIKMASTAAAAFGASNAVVEVPANLEPIAFAMEVQNGRVETAAMVPTGVLAIMWDQAKAQLMPKPPPPAGDGAAPREGAAPNDGAAPRESAPTRERATPGAGADR